jgi:hypothetical protein
MSITTTIAALQALHATVAGVQSAPIKKPGSLATAKLPCVLTYASNGRWTHEARDMRQHTRIYLVRVFVEPIAQSTQDRIEQQEIALIEAFAALYLDTTELATGAEIVYAPEGITDTGAGLTLLTYLNEQYEGFEFRVQVWEDA